MGNLSLNNDAEMSLKHLRLHESYKTQTANDTKPTTTTQCSHCNSLSSSFLKNSEITRRNCVCHHKRSVNTQRLSAHAKSTMSNKFLLVYVIVFIASCPFVQCMRHQDTLNTNSLSQVTPSTNSIGSTATLNDRSETTDDDDSDNDEIEDSEEDQYAHTPAHDEVAKMYAKQFRAYPKNVPKKEDPQNSQLTTIKPQQTARQTASNSCSSSMCRTRQDIEEASTASIRKHILMKLGFEHEPNITKYPKLTEEYRKILCKLNNFSSEDCLGKKPPRVEYQSDEPVDSYDEYEADRDLDRDIVSEEEEDVQFLSYENRIYAFPSTEVKVRHKSHLVFQFMESQEMNNAVSQATLNIYVHSKNYLRSTDMQLPKNLRLIDIEIAKILQGSQHKMIFETFRNISLPDGGNSGEFIKLNITQMVAEWFMSHETSHGMAVKVTASKSGLILPHKIVSLDSENYITRPFIDILPRDQRKKRTKRSSLRCTKGSNESRCCRHDLTVDFDKFGWDWIIAPKKYDANYCAGECKIAFMQQYAHTHVMQLSTAANPCCSPRKMTHMQLLYFDSQLNIVLGTIPNMIVDECFCS